MKQLVLYAIGTLVIWSLVNVADRWVANRFLKTPWVMVLFSALVSSSVGAALFNWEPHPFYPTLSAMGSGAFYALAVSAYASSFMHGEASRSICKPADTFVRFSNLSDSCALKTEVNL